MANYLRNSFKCIFVILILFISIAPHEANSADVAQIDSIVNACIAANSKDKICTAIVEFKQIGDDAIEVIKNYADLSPEQYAFLTVANVFIQGRLRVRTKSMFLKSANDVYDLRKDSAMYLIEMKF